MASPRGHKPPDSKEDLDKLAERLIDVSGVADILPTPLEQVAESKDLAVITDQSVIQDYMDQLQGSPKRIFRSAIEKLRGAADLRERVVFVPDETNRAEPRRRFATGHEIAHQCIEWHQIDFDGFLDDEQSLSPEISEEFENEANYLGALLNFQGRRFVTKTRSVKPTISAIRHFSELHGMSFQATAWHFIESSDEIVALGFYYPNNPPAGLSSTSFKLWKCVSSPRFSRQFGNDAFPDYLMESDPLVSIAAEGSTDDYQMTTMPIGSEKRKVQVQSFWNNYNLTVLVRKAPRLASFGRLRDR